MATAPVRILVIDDDPDDAELTRLALEDSDWPVDCRTLTRPDGLARALDAFAPQLVLCDVNLPGWSCSETRAAVCAVSPDARFVLLTGALPCDGNLPGADAVLLKDQLPQLPALLRGLLAG